MYFYVLLGTFRYLIPYLLPSFVSYFSSDGRERQIEHWRDHWRDHSENSVPSFLRRTPFLQDIPLRITHKSLFLSYGHFNAS